MYIIENFLQQIIESYRVRHGFFGYVLFSGLCLLMVFGFYHLIYYSVRRILGKKDNGSVTLLRRYLYRPALLVFLLMTLVTIETEQFDLPRYYQRMVNQGFTIALIIAYTYFFVQLAKGICLWIFGKYEDFTATDLQARKVFTQARIIERILVIFIVVTGLAFILLTFKEVRIYGKGILASAGVFGLILGFSAQKTLGTLFAGIQIAIAQPIRIDDVVVVNGNWGRIKEIFLTYVVVRCWDNRQLIVPINYFLENTFENWTHTTSDLYGTVFIYADYSLPIAPLKSKLLEVLASTELWDGLKSDIQITNLTAETMEIRALVSAADSEKAFDLRCLVRQELIGFIQTNYPESLPKTRLSLEKQT